ncbi:hypothetical protein J31TS6_55500 [Brevibacillus reuszeri]|uniref:hypothetical protein n=1 Tax=Brevibacillus reuszeri TaxID=54915 RepID=UPI001B2AE499|nr:hypothetical protein [Brevibacillus reuszeri]GIO09522.1 hypothetical protein J31TS6_55500 [Brevibacillus reuszeri]
MKLSHDHESLLQKLRSMPHYTLTGQKTDEIQKVLLKKVEQSKSKLQLYDHLKWIVVGAAVFFFGLLFYKNYESLLPVQQSAHPSPYITTGATAKSVSLDNMPDSAKATFEKVLTAFPELRLPYTIESDYDRPSKRQVYEMTLKKEEDIAIIAIDEKTGQLIAFTRYGLENDAQTPLSIEQAKEKATEWLTYIDKQLAQDYIASTVTPSAIIHEEDGKEKPTEVQLKSIVEFQPRSIPTPLDSFSYFVTLDAQGELMDILFRPSSGEENKEVEQMLQAAWGEAIDAFQLTNVDWVKIDYFEMEELLHHPPISLGNSIEAAYLQEIAKTELRKYRIKGDTMPLLLVHPTEKQAYMLWKRENGVYAALELHQEKEKWVGQLFEKIPDK